MRKVEQGPLAAKRRAGLFLCLTMKLAIITVLMPLALVAQPQYTTISDTIYTPVSGAPFNGTLKISGAVSVDISANTIAAWNQTVSITGGALNVSLVVSPAGTQYVLLFTTYNGASFEEVCQIGASSPARLSTYCQPQTYPPLGTAYIPYPGPGIPYATGFNTARVATPCTDYLTPAGCTIDAATINGTTFPADTVTDAVYQIGGTVGTGQISPIPDCPDSGLHLNYTAATHTWSCGDTGGTGGSVNFSGVGSGTNGNALLVSGTLAPTGGGAISANEINGTAAVDCTSYISPTCLDSGTIPGNLNLLTVGGNVTVGGTLGLSGTAEGAIKFYDSTHTTQFVISGPTTGYSQTIYTPGAALVAGAPLGLNGGNQLYSLGFTGDASNVVAGVPGTVMTVGAIQNNAVTPTAPTTAGDVYCWNTGSSAWLLCTLPQIAGVLAAAQMPAFTGDMTNAAGTVAASVVGIRGVSISATAPTTGQGLRLAGGIWTPTFLDAPNYESWCNGAVGASLSTEYYLFPGSTTTTGMPCTGTTAFGMPISGPCTAFALIAKSSAAGKDASSGVVTLYHNGAQSALTCTLKTGTTCSDGADSVTFSSGDTFYVGVETSTSNATDTTANLRVAFQCQ